MRRWLGGLLAALALATVAVGAGRTLVAAHRGGAALWPENSLRAFRGALALGVDALELDLHQTADGEVIVIHDPTLERTTTGRGALRDATWAALEPLRLRDREGRVTDERVPRLAELLDLAAPARVELLPEIKTATGGQPYPGIEARVLELLKARGLLGRATIQAFQAETLARLRALEPSARTMLLVSRARVERGRAAPVEAVRWARDAGATDLGLDHRLADESVVAAARAARIRLSVWTVNEEVDLGRVIGLGVDVVMSDRPDLALRLVGR
jgi:glycerophosphoryl diester phosphodiesterase